MEFLSKVYNSLTRPAPFNRYDSRLRAKYSAVDLLLPPTQSSTQARRVPLDTLFVKLVVLPKSKVDEHLGEQDFGSVDEAVKLQSALADIGRPEDAIELKDLFSSEGAPTIAKSGCRLSVTSCAGGGKTTLFLQHAAQEWARGNLWKQFQLLAAMPLRLQSVHKAKHLADLLQLCKFGIIDQAEQTAIIDYIKSNPKLVCFIMDGLDEVKMEECSEYVQEVLQGKEENGINIIITSRHSKNILSFQRNFPFDRQYEIIGFSEEEITSFIQKRLDDADAESFLKAMSTTEHIKSLMCTPFFLSNSCHLFLDTHVLPDSVSSLYSGLILRSINTSTGRTYKEWSALPDDTKASILEVGSFAFRMLVENKTVFSQNEVEDFCLSPGAKALELFIPCASSPFASLDQSQFPHLSVQEAIAAKYAVTICNTPDDVTRLVCTLGPLTGALATFWILLAAELSPVCLDSLVSAILTVPTCKSSSSHDDGSDDDDDNTDYVTAPERTLMTIADDLSQFLSRNEAETLAVHLLSPSTGGQGEVALNALLQPDTSTLLYLKRLLLLWQRKAFHPSKQRLRQVVAEINPSAAMGCFGPPSVSHPPQHEPVVKLCTPEGRQRLLLASRCAYESLRISNTTTPPSMEESSPAPSLSHALATSGLNLQSTRVSLADCQVLNQIMSIFSGSIRHVDFYNCGLTDSSLAIMLSGLSQCTALTGLRLSRNSLTDKHVDQLSDVIRRNAATLHDLGTSANDLSSAGVSSLHRYTPLCTGLQELSVGSRQCRLREVDLCTVNPILGSCTNLTHVFLTGCHLGDDGLAQLMPLLQSLRLTSLSLGRTGLHEVSAPVLVDLIVANSECLEAINLAQNAVGDGAFQDVSAALQLCSNLQWALMQKIHITSKSISSLNKVVLRCPRLLGLRLAKNDFRGPGDELQFAAAVQASQSLEELGMPERRLVSAKMCELLEALEKPKLAVTFTDWA